MNERAGQDVERMVEQVQTRALPRTVFVTNRALDFCSEKELIAQTGHEPEDWPLVVLKELIDNSLDACEEAGIDPTLAVTVDERGITVSDKGPGIPESTIRGITDFSVRVSSREAYVAPDRGKQGNALKTILAMPFVLDGDCGKVQIASGGVLYRIELQLDRVRSVPIITISTEPSKVKIGTSITVDWPDSASSILEEAKAGFYKLAADAAFLNPHLTITLNWFGEKSVTAGDAGWSKWKPKDPTCPHWYGVDNLARLIGAYIAHDSDHGGRRTLREFIGEFRGLSGTAKQKAVAAACGLSGAALDDLVVDGQLDMALVERLLSAMQSQSKPVKPQALGVLGRDHLYGKFEGAGCEMGSFEYRKVQGTTDDGIPWVAEAAFAVDSSAFDSQDDQVDRSLITGINWSPCIINPFRQLRHYDSLDSILANQRAGRDEPVVVALHLACPRIEYTDRGKSAVRLMDAAMQEAIVGAVLAVTAKWCKQRKAEEREAASAARRRERMTRPERRWTQVEAADAVMEKAYLAASADGRLPAHARQVMYQARGPMQELTGKTLGKGFDQYFCQTLLPNYLAEHPAETEKWDVVFDARGHFTEPHTKRSVPLGTLQVRSYLGETADPSEHPCGWSDLDTCSYNTCGPRHRYSAILFIEKEGFTPLFDAVNLAERYDLAIMSTKGVSVVASRMLVDRLCAEHDIPLLVVHDFDKSGFVIAGTLSRSTRRYEFSSGHALRVVDLGLRLEDVTARDLPAEEVCHGRSDPTDNLTENGATAEEIAFLCRGHEYNRGGYWGQRVELNAFTSDALVGWIEGKLDALGIKKIVPDEATLEQAYRGAAEADYINRHTSQIAEAAQTHAARISIPDDLRIEVEERLHHDRRIPWDQAVGEILGEEADGE